MKRSFSLFRGSITEVDADCIVNSSNTLGALGTGVSAAIREECGIELQEEIHRAIDEILGKESMPWGEAAATSGGKSGRYRCVVHAAVMNYSKGTRSFPGTTIEIVSKATSNSLRRVVEFLPQDIPFSIAFPAMGAGVGHLGIDESCRAVVQGLRTFFKQQPDVPIHELVFVGMDPAGIDSFRRALVYGLGLPENMIQTREGRREHG